ncbi:terminase [Deinococcus oregonensis]|uniref:Terminase n=1 Tax=Deinococcus oregonensis TaxID=1805970 RepID=A0ABV6AUX6_9DEIO
MKPKHDLTEVVSGKLRINLHRGQWKAWQSQARFVVVLAGTQGGKTSFGPLWFYREIQRCGPGDYIVATPTFPLLELKLLPEFKRLFERQLKLGKYVASPTKKFVFSEAGARRTFGDRYDPDVPTQIFFGHAQDPDSLESATAKAAWLDEAGQKKFKKGSHDALLRRLAIHQGRILYTTTPYYLGWLKKELHDRAKKGDPDIELINFRSIDNPAFPRSEYEDRKAKMPAWKHAMFYDGVFTRPAGMIYDIFDWDSHVVEPFDIPDHWPRFAGLDFGGVNTAGVKIAQEPETGMYYLYAEYHRGRVTAATHVENLLIGEPEDGEGQAIPPRAVGGAPSEDNWRLEFTKGGLFVERPPISDVEVGIDRVYGLLKRNALKIFSTCTGLLGDDTNTGEIERYSRALDDQGEPTEAIEDKHSFHLLDGLRYIASVLDEPEIEYDVPVSHSFGFGGG